MTEIVKEKPIMFYVPEDLKKRFCRIMIDEGTTMRHVLKAYVEDFVSKHEGTG